MKDAPLRVTSWTLTCTIVTGIYRLDFDHVLLSNRFIHHNPNVRRVHDIGVEEFCEASIQDLTLYFRVAAVTAMAEDLGLTCLADDAAKFGSDHGVSFFNRFSR